MKTFLKYSLVALVLTLGAGTAHAQNEQGGFGLGYQSILSADLFHSISARAWLNEQIAVQAGVFVVHGSVESEDGGILVGSGRFLFAPVTREHSRFYVGAELDYGFTFGSAADENDPSLLIVSPFFGAEFHLADLPELGFNWDIGYRINTVTNIDEDVVLSGTFISMGMHYYF